MSFKEKYLKYKNKYLNLKNQIGGSPTIPGRPKVPSLLPNTSQLQSPRSSQLSSQPSSRPGPRPPSQPSSRPSPRPGPRQSPQPLPRQSPQPLSRPSPQQSFRPSPRQSPQQSFRPSPRSRSLPVSPPVSPPVPPQVPPTCLQREKSLFLSIQDGDTCFMHAATRMICRLLKNCILFKFSIEQCNAYYSIINCRDDVFKCFLKNPCPTLKKDKIYKDRLAEDLSALLFYFIYLKIEEIFKSCDGGDDTIASLYILDFIKYAEINIDTIITVLNYNKTNYKKEEDTEYFNNLMNELLSFLNIVKQKLKKEEFNPISYHMGITNDKTDENFILYDNPKLYYEGDKQLFIPSKTTVIKPKISKLSWNYNKVYHNYPFNKTPLEILKQILKEGYYATLSIVTIDDTKASDDKKFGHVVVITDISGNDLVIKNTWGDTSPDAEEKWCPLFKNQKINFFKLIDKKNNLNMVTFTISFFYNVPNYKGQSFMHTATSLVIQLLKLSFPTFFRDVIQENRIYYNLITCNDQDRNIFDYFFEFKNPDWLKENFLALLFHFIFLKIKENYEQLVFITNNPKETSFYILYYIINEEISEEKIRTLLRYSELYDTINKNYFNKLINNLFNFFKKVKNKFKFKTFNPIIYSVTNEETKFSINDITKKPDILLQKKISWFLENTDKYLFNKIKKLETLKIILKEGYYAFLFFNDNLNYLIITEIDNNNNLVVNNKWDRNIPIDILKKWLPFITPNYKISFNELEKINYNITFFYNEYDNRPKSLPITYEATILITQLLKSSFPKSFTDITQECGFYYNLSTCTNKDANIFDCFLEYKSNKNEYPTLVDKSDWLNENFLALLFHFIFKICETNVDINKWSWLNILDILKYIKDKKDIDIIFIKRVLNYKENNYEKEEDKYYFNKLINNLETFFNQVKNKIKFKTFNPILYYLSHKVKSENFEIRYNINYNDTTKVVKWDGDSRKYPFINKSVLDTLKTIIRNGYYASLRLHTTNEQFIITGIDDDNKLVIKNTWEKDICYYNKKKKECKIDLNELLQISEYTIYFFYNVPEYIPPFPSNCFIHAATILVTQLLKTSFSTYFSDVTQECDLYYNLITCKNKDVTIFDCFLETKSNDDYTMPRDSTRWLKENFVALLFHFIFLKMNETFEKNCGYEALIGGALYILKYIEDTEIKEFEVGRLLKYNKPKYTQPDNIYFNLLINKLYMFLIEVKKQLQELTFKPIIYYLTNEDKDFNAIFNITYTSTPNQPAEYNYNLKGKNGPFSNQNLLETLTFILKEKYYAFLEIQNMPFIITSIDDKNNLVIKNTWEKNKCFHYNEDLNSLLTNECKIKFDELRKSDLEYSLGFFYNNIFFNPENLVKNQVNNLF